MKSTMQAVIVEKSGGTLQPRIGNVETRNLPAGDLVVQVSHTGLNYSDAAYMFGIFGEPPAFPHVPGIDFVGAVLESRSPDVLVGQRVMHTSYGVGYNRWGGMAEYAVSNAKWVILPPDALEDRHLMALGTPALTAMLGIEGLERNGVNPLAGPILVTGSTGGVGSHTVHLLSTLGYSVVAVTGKPQHSAYLKALGAERIMPREALLSGGLGQSYAAVVDCVGGEPLTQAVRAVRYGGVVVVTGVAASFAWGVHDLGPFVMNALTVVGVNSVYTPEAQRRAVWRRIFSLADRDILERILAERPFADLPELGAQILKGTLKGRVVSAIPSGR